LVAVLVGLFLPLGRNGFLFLLYVVTHLLLGCVVFYNC